MPGFKTLIFYLGRGLQFAALVFLPYALWLGMKTDDPKTELSLLALGGAQFLLGVLIVRAVGAR